MEIPGTRKSTGWLVFESHQWGEKMTCRNFSVGGCCVRCQGDEGVIRQCPPRPLPFCSLPGHSGPAHYYQFFSLKYCRLTPNSFPWNHVVLFSELSSSCRAAYHPVA